MIDSQMEKVKFGQKKSREPKSATGVPFVITYHPKFKEIASTLKKYQNILLISLGRDGRTIKIVTGHF